MGNLYSLQLFFIIIFFPELISFRCFVAEVPTDKYSFQIFRAHKIYQFWK